MRVVFALNSFLGLQIAQQTVEVNKYCSAEVHQKEMSSEVTDVTRLMNPLGSLPLSDDQIVDAAKNTALEARKINPGADIYVAFADGQIHTENQCSDRSVAVSITKDGNELISYGDAHGARLDPNLGGWDDNKYPSGLKTGIFAVVHGWGDMLEQALHILSRALPRLHNFEQLTGKTRTWLQQNALGISEITLIRNGVLDFEKQFEAIKEEVSKLVAVHRATSSQRVPGISRNVDGPIVEILPRLENALKDIKSVKAEIDSYIERHPEVFEAAGQALRNQRLRSNNTASSTVFRFRFG